LGKKAMVKSNGKKLEKEEQQSASRQWKMQKANKQ